MIGHWHREGDKQYYPVGTTLSGALQNVPSNRFLRFLLRSYRAYPAFPASCTVGRLRCRKMRETATQTIRINPAASLVVTCCLRKRWKYCVIPGEGRLWLCCGIQNKPHRDMRAKHAFIDWTRAEQKRDIERRQRSAISVCDPPVQLICICEGCIGAHSCAEVVSR